MICSVCGPTSLHRIWWWSAFVFCSHLRLSAMVAVKNQGSAAQCLGQFASYRSLPPGSVVLVPLPAPPLSGCSSLSRPSRPWPPPLAARATSCRRRARRPSLCVSLSGGLPVQCSSPSAAFPSMFDSSGQLPFAPHCVPRGRHACAPPVPGPWPLRWCAGIACRRTASGSVLAPRSGTGGAPQIARVGRCVGGTRVNPSRARRRYRTMFSYGSTRARGSVLWHSGQAWSASVHVGPVQSRPLVANAGPILGSFAPSCMCMAVTDFGRIRQGARRFVP